jgi:hypothetical protein
MVPQGGDMPRRAQYDSDAVYALARRQDNCLTLRQLCELGVPSSSIAQRTRPKGGPWQRPLPGIVLIHNGTPTPREKVAAALLYAGANAVVTGAVALRRHGLKDVPECNPGDVHVLVPATRHRTSHAFVIVERTIRPPEPVVIDGFPCAPVARAVVDHSRRIHDLGAVRAMSTHALQRRFTTADKLRSEVLDGPRQGSARVRESLEHVLSGIRSALEAEYRDLIRGSGLPEPEWNVDLFTPDGEFIASPDGWLADVGVANEVESRQHHMSPEDWEATQVRRARMASYGIIVVPVTFRRMREEPEKLIKDMRRAIAAGSKNPRLPLVAVRRSQAA